MRGNKKKKKEMKYAEKSKIKVKNKEKKMVMCLKRIFCSSFWSELESALTGGGRERD